VLGCRVIARVPHGLEGAAGRRAGAAAEAFFAGRAPVIVASGGRAWDGRVEADALADALFAAGVPKEAIVRERCSFSTVENALFTARILERRGARAVGIVTCAWHLPRALRAFRAQGVVCEGVPAHVDGAGAGRRAYWEVREAIASWLER
jgi:uncharacterized SAM-binding protein YcdF (DUF218 family)